MAFQQRLRRISDSIRGFWPFKRKSASKKTDNEELQQEEEDDVSGFVTLKEKITLATSPKENTHPRVHLVPVERQKLEAPNFIQKFTYGRERLDKREYVIMMVGATGSGKTTLINGMVNYLFGVKWEDEIQFQLIHEDVETNQAKSQTRHITSYTLYFDWEFLVPYTLTIVDTPGFGDTAGIDRDKEITEQIKTFFTTEGEDGIDHLDAVGFVVPASLPRLTATQKYIFDAILTLFGTDIKENIFLMLTFADASRPQVLSSITEAGMKPEPFYKFNNSALYANNDVVDAERPQGDDSAQFQHLFWKLGLSNFESFFNDLEKITPKSLILTKQVLSERAKVQLLVTEIQRGIKHGLYKLQELQRIIQIVENEGVTPRKANKYQYKALQEKKERKELMPGTYVTNCTICNWTCHGSCRIESNENKEECSAMGGDGHCEICPEKCHWSNHQHAPYRYEENTILVTKPVSKVYEEYAEKLGVSPTKQELLNKLGEDFLIQRIFILVNTQKVRESLERLEMIALKPHHVSTIDYIDLLIEREHKLLEEGWKERVEHLKDLQAEVKSMIEMSEKNFDPFQEHMDLLKTMSFQTKSASGMDIEKTFVRLKALIKD